MGSCPVRYRPLWAHLAYLYTSSCLQDCAIVLQVFSATEAEAVSRAIRAEESLKKADEALRQLKSWYDSAVGRLTDVCAERRRLRAELASLREQSRHEREVASARVQELERQVSALTGIVTEEFTRVRDLWARIDTVERERLAARQVAVQRAPVAPQNSSMANLLWCLFLLMLGACLAVVTQR